MMQFFDAPSFCQVGGAQMLRTNQSKHRGIHERCGFGRLHRGIQLGGQASALTSRGHQRLPQQPRPCERCRPATGQARGALERAHPR